MLIQSDKKQIEALGMSEISVQEQLRDFQEGFPSVKLIKPALLNQGILTFDQAELTKLIRLYESSLAVKKVVKFVPASGAATRMFQALFECLGTTTEGLGLSSLAVQNKAVQTFFKQLKDFAFYEELEQLLINKGLSVDDPFHILNCLLTAQGLNYGQLPKGLIKFHREDGILRTATEEHIVEACAYASSGAGEVYLHFTVSQEHQEKFEEHVAIIKDTYQTKYGVKIVINYSQQQKATDTIAVDLENNPVRNQQGALLFRPAGHGALLENLNGIEADLIFIKNIDNVVPDRLKFETIRYKKLLAGTLLSFQSVAFDLLNILEQAPTDQQVIEINGWVRDHLGYVSDAPLDRKQLFEVLNRPMRVCGMVKSEGNPGGGPFWVQNKEARTLQIVETAQVNFEQKDQKQIFEVATHFNPVDIVCVVRNFQGIKFDLIKYRDPSTGFITQKSKDGKPLKALELPGLWNGAMASWNTIFVEVPLITFNPVKSINDLLLPEHV